MCRRVTALLVLVSGYAPAETITVAKDGSGAFSSIQEAIDLASDGDIVLVQPGEYVVREPIHFNPLRDPEAAPQGIVKNLTLRSADGAAVTTIRFEHTGTSSQEILQNAVVFQEGESRASMIEGFLITGATQGAGIRCYRASPRIRSCHVTENTFRGIRMAGGAPLLEDCVISRNGVAGISLGGCSAEIVNCSILENFGNGILNGGGSTRFEACSVLANTESGLSTSGEPGPSFDGCKFMGNAASNHGGGIEARGAVELRNCVIAGNTVGSGSYGAAMASHRGGAIRAIHCTVADNLGFDRAMGALWCLDGTIELRNTVVSGNSPSSVCGTSSASILETVDPRFIRRGGYDFNRSKQVTIRGIPMRLPWYIVDSGDYSLAEDSPALEAGEPGLVQNDILGVRRPCGRYPDLGAYELCSPDPFDCNQNGAGDDDDLSSGESIDCNRNGKPDECDVRYSGPVFSGVSLDHRDPIESFAIADIDRDGDLDVVLNSDRGVLSVLKTIAGSLQEWWYSNAPHPKIRLLAGDADLDGNVDMVASGTNELQVYKNKGTGLFNSAGEPPRSSPLDGTPISGVLVHLDNDSRIDFAAVGAAVGEHRLFLFANATGPVFSSVGSLGIGSRPAAIVAADFNRDGLSDLAMAGSGMGEEKPWARIAIAREGGSIVQLKAPTDLELEPSALAAADLDGDGDGDLAVLSRTPGQVTVLFHKGAGSFDRGGSYSCGPEPRLIAAADMTRDGMVDLICAGGAAGVFILPNLGDRTFGVAAEATLPAVSSWLDVADLNGDDRLDLVLSDPGEGFLTVVRNWTVYPASEDEDLDGIPDECGRRRFRRGDVNVDATLDISDPVCVLVRLFGGGHLDFCSRHEIACLEAADANNDGAIDLSDAVHLLRSLFLDLGPLPAPEACGEDPDPRGSAADLGCREYDPCG